MKLLITGGAGFIGCNFVKLILSTHRRVHVTNLDLLTYSGRPENISDIRSENHQFVKGDIRDANMVNALVKEGEFDAILNFAAETHVDRSLAHSSSFISTDVIGTHVLLEAARKYDVPRFIQVSTDEVYGSAGRNKFAEDSRLNPSSPYSASKASGDLVAMSYYTSYSMNVIVTRSSNNFGPNQYPEKFIPKMIVRAINGDQIPIYGNGRQVRDWIYVEDNCAAIATVLRKGSPGKIYNISADNYLTNISVARTILKRLRKPKSLIVHVEDRPGHDRKYSITNNQVRALGWKPTHTFESALANTIGWYVSNKWWWEPLLGDKFFVSNTPWNA